MVNIKVFYAHNIGDYDNNDDNADSAVIKILSHLLFFRKTDDLPREIQASTGKEAEHTFSIKTAFTSLDQNKITTSEKNKQTPSSCMLLVYKRYNQKGHLQFKILLK